MVLLNASVKRANGQQFKELEKRFGWRSAVWSHNFLWIEDIVCCWFLFHWQSIRSILVFQLRVVVIWSRFQVGRCTLAFALSGWVGHCACVKRRALRCYVLLVVGEAFAQTRLEFNFSWWLNIVTTIRVCRLYLTYMVTIVLWMITIMTDMLDYNGV